MEKWESQYKVKKYKVKNIQGKHDIVAFFPLLLLVCHKVERDLKCFHLNSKMSSSQVEYKVNIMIGEAILRSQQSWKKQ